MTSEKRINKSDSECLKYSLHGTPSEGINLEQLISGSNADGIISTSSIEENPTDLPSSESSIPSILYDAIPPIQDQRSIVANMWVRFNNEKKEGDLVFIIPERWLALFQDPNIIDYRSIPSIDVASISLDYKNFILQDYTQHLYTAVPASMFTLLQQWYDLTPNSKPISTFIVRDANNQLLVEYDRPRCRIHHLVAGNGNANIYPGSSRHSIDHKIPLMFTMSRLATMKDVIQRCLEVFYAKEPHLDKSSLTHRIWYINERVADPKSTQTLLSNYVLSPSAFLELQTKHEITKSMYSRQLKDYDSQIISLVVEVKQKSSNQHWPSNFFHYNKLNAPSGIMGLSNLGNTCYMNSALQCLLHIPELNEYFLYKGYEREININNPLGHKGDVAHAFGHLLYSLFAPSYGQSTFYAPRNFKNTIGHYNSLFAGYGQQDSQEFLAFLLDGLHEDLNRVIEKPYVNKPEFPNDGQIDDTDQIVLLAANMWDYIKKRNDSVIMDLFVGLYKSTLVCPNCNHVSITFDPYNDLTLPLPIENYWSTKVTIFPQNSPPCTLEVELSKTSSYNDLKAYVAQHANMHANDLIGAEIFNHQFYNNYESNVEADYLPISELISESDTVIFYEVHRGQDDLVVPILNTRFEEGFKTPRLFGYPFFIALSQAEQFSYGAIRKKIEKCYQNFSGGFSEFPIVGKTKMPDLSSMPLLEKRYSQCEIESIMPELEYINPEMSVDEFFQLKILKVDSVSSNRRVTSFSGVSLGQTSDEPNSQIWIPPTASLITYNHSELIRKALPEAIEAAYYYSDMLSNEDDIPNDQTVSDTANDLATKSYTSPNPEENVTSSAEALDGTLHLKVSPLLDVHNAIICEWEAVKVINVFDEDNGVNWDHPAILENLSLSEVRKTRAQTEKSSITLDSCLRLFSQPEILGSADSWYCPNCKQHTQASKQIELWNTPDILLIHLKRFENQRSFSDKIDATVKFPIEGLDMSPYLSYKKEGENDVYDLIAVDNHYGGLGGGHYTAYCRNFIDGKWYYFDDSRVNEVSPENSIAGSAYLLFYRRRTSGNQTLGNGKLRDIIDISRKEYEQKQDEFMTNVETLYAATHTDTESEASDSDRSSVDEEMDPDNSDCENDKKSAFVDQSDISSNSLGMDNLTYSNRPSKDNTIHTSKNANGSIESTLNNNELPEAEQTVTATERKGALQYNVSSLEVGSNIAKLDTHDSSRRKLRLLDKIYLPDSSNLNSSTDSLSPCISHTESSSNNNES